MKTKLSLQLKESFWQNYLLIWLDDKANSQSEYLQFRDQLQTIINHLKIFQTINQYEEYLRTISDYVRVSLLIDFPLSSEIISHEHSFKRLSSIYIYGGEKLIDDQRVKYIDNIPSDELLVELQIDQTKAIEPFAFSLYKPILNLNQPLTFFYFQILLDCLLRMETFIPNHTYLIALLQEIYPNEFEQIYSADQALEWYQQKTCLSKLFNQILCSTNVNLLFLFQFFLRDLQQQLKKKQYSSSIRLYKTRCLSNEDIELLKKCIGDFLSINSFLTVKSDRQEAIANLDSSGILQSVLFEIELKCPTEKSFAYLNTSDVLIMCGSIFRILDVRLNDNHLWIIQLKSYQITDEDLKFSFQSIKTEIDYNEQDVNLLTFGKCLWKMKQLNQAEDYFLYLVDILSDDHIDRVEIYYHLGHIYSEKNQYDLSLKFYEKSLNIWKNCLQSNDINLANNYNAIATNLWKKGDYQQAYQSFHRALEIFQQIFGDNHITVGMCLNNLATVISDEKDYSKMLNYYLKALKIFENNLSINHPNLASLHCNISTMYKNLNQFDLALEHMNLSLKIYEKLYPMTHPNVSMALKNIAYLHEQKHDIQQALNYYEKLSHIYRQTLTSTDPLVRQNEEKIQDLLAKLSKN